MRHITPKSIRTPFARYSYGVEVPAGHHRVIFQFAPFGLDNLRDALKLVITRGQ